MIKNYFKDCSEVDYDIEEFYSVKDIQFIEMGLNFVYSNIYRDDSLHDDWKCTKGH